MAAAINFSNDFRHKCKISHQILLQETRSRSVKQNASSRHLPFCFHACLFTFCLKTNIYYEPLFRGTLEKTEMWAGGELLLRPNNPFTSLCPINKLLPFVVDKRLWMQNNQKPRSRCLTLGTSSARC